MKTTMKKLLALTLALVCLFSLVACGDKDKENENTTPAVMADVVSAVLAAVPGSDKLTDVQESYLGGFFNGAKAEDFANHKIVVQSVSTSIDEIGIFEAKTAEDVKKIETMVDDYFTLRNDIWDERYLQEEYPKLQKAERVTKGNFVMYVILGDDTRDAAIKAFKDTAN